MCVILSIVRFGSIVLVHCIENRLLTHEEETSKPNLIFLLLQIATLRSILKHTERQSGTDLN